MLAEKTSGDHVHPEPGWVFQTPVSQLRRELQGKTAKRRHSLRFVCNFQIEPAGAATGGLSAHLDPVLWDFPQTEWVSVQGLQEPFQISVWNLVGWYLCVKVKPVPPQWKIPPVNLFWSLLWHSIRLKTACSSSERHTSEKVVVCTFEIVLLLLYESLHLLLPCVFTLMWFMLFFFLSSGKYWSLFLTKCTPFSLCYFI